MTLDELYKQVAEYAALKAQAEYAVSAQIYKQAENGTKASELMLQRARNVNRPCMLLGAELYEDNNGWFARFGGLEVHGDTPELAFQNFDNKWIGKEYK